MDASEVTALRARNLIAPCHRITPGHAFPDWSIRFLRDRLVPRPGVNRRRSRQRLYVERRDAAHRRLMKEEDVVSLLLDYGFRPIQAEKMNFLEQVAAFGESEMIVGPHGGGLANMLFCPPRAKVIELSPYLNFDLYYRLATKLELDYYCVMGEKGAGSGSEDYSIDIRKIEETLDAVVSQL